MMWRRRKIFMGFGPAWLFLGLLWSINSQAAPDEVSRIVARYGLSAVTPKSVASDFELPDLSNKRVKLSSGRGRFTLLTFFATWCGACKSELPSLERLYRDLDPKKTWVLGVALDDDRRGLSEFVSRLGLTFDVLVDSDGRVGSLYHASSIPLTYLIDPSGQIVGVARGARDWSKLGGLFKDLLALDLATDSGSQSYASQDSPVELPSTLVPPTAEIILPKKEVYPGQPFELLVKVKWAGSLDDYILLPPGTSLPEGITQTGVSASSSSQDGRAVVTYNIALLAQKQGTFALDPIELRYLTRLEKEPMTSRSKGPSVTVVPKIFWRLVLIGAATLGMLVLGIWGIRRYKRLKTKPKPSDNLPATLLAQALPELKRRRLEGDLVGFLNIIAELDNALAVSKEERLPLELLSQVRYGGKLPDTDLLNLHERRLERYLAVQTGKTQAAERESIRLAEPTE